MRPYLVPLLSTTPAPLRNIKPDKEPYYYLPFNILTFSREGSSKRAKLIGHNKLSERCMSAANQA